MNKIKKSLAVLMTACVAVSASTVTSFAASPDKVIENDYLRLGVDSGRFIAYKTDGTSSTDNEQRLLYGDSKLDYDAPYGTSRVYFSVDGSVSYRTSYEQSISDDGKTITESFNYDGVEFTKSYEFVNNSVTGKDDAFSVTLKATNTSDESKNVGCRIMFDTMLDSNDSAPFRVPGIGPVTTRTRLVGDQITKNYQVFDDLSNPTITASGSFATGSGKPDEVQYNNYFISSSDVLVPDVDSSSAIGDSTVNGIWYEKALAPGESRTYTGYYGLGEVIVSRNGKISVGATKVEQNFEVNADGTGYNPVSLMGYLKNSGDIDLNNVKLSISLPSGVELVSGENTITYSQLASNAEQQTTWQLKADPSNVERKVTVTISADSDETSEPASVDVSYVIPAISGEVIDNTEPVTTVPETTIAPTTVEASSTASAATADTSTKKATADTADNNAVQTGNTGLVSAVVVLIAGLAFAAVMYYKRKINL